MPRFKEFEIRDFLGIASSKRSPQKNEAQLCKNFDLREITGDLTSRRGYRLKYAAPIAGDMPNVTDVSWIRATNIVIDINGTEQEVTLLIGKGTLAYIGTGGAVASINIGLFFIRPWYNPAGPAFADDWLWLNECYYTDIDNLSNNTFRINGTFENTADYFKDWIAYNVSEDCYHQIYDSAYVDATETTVSLVAATGSVTHDFANSDRVLIMRNFIPYADLQEYYNVTQDEISFHNVLSDLRIGFGGKANRLGLMIGYRNKSFQVENDAGGLLGGSGIQQVTDINKIILTPYNTITEDTKAATIPAWGDQNAFHIYIYKNGASNYLPAGRWFWKMTALLDGYEEFILPAKLYDGTSDINALGTLQSSNYIDSNGSEYFTIDIRIFYALLNKRTTKIRLYVSYDSSTSNQPDEPTAPYYLYREYDLIGAAASTGYDFNNYGYLYDEPNTSPNSLTLSYWTQMNKSGTTELEAKLNYPITDDYVRGWDHAVVVDRVCFVINPYIDGERLNNYIYFSPFSGAGASQYDALQSGNYINLDSHDGNNLRGLGVFGNANLAAFKNNTLQKVRANTAQVADLAFGYGLDTFRSIVNHGDKLTWCSQEDILSTNGVQVQNISEDSIRNIFRALNTKSSIRATREERENAYRFCDGSGVEYLFTKRGWVNIDQAVDPVDYIIAKDGTIWFMAAGNIYYQTGYQDVNSSDATQNMSLQWKSIPFDISLLGEGLIQSNRIWVDGIFCKYSTPTNLSLLVYIDGTLHDTITLSSTETYYDAAIKYGALGYKVEIEITGTVNSSTRVIVSSVGFRYRVLETGNRV